MKRIDLIQVPHNVQIGDKCELIEPNITEDSIFYDNGVPIGFYIKQLPPKALKLACLADQEFRSKNVPKSMMSRSSELQARRTGGEGVQQYSTIIGSCAPKPHMRRPYPSISSVHQVKSAQTFIKAMWMLAIEAEGIMKEITPNVYEQQVRLFEDVPKEWRFGNLFTSSISNYNIPAAFHRDAANIQGAVNVIVTKRSNARGGNLHVPDYNATMDSCDNSMLVYPAWKNVHGVTPIVPTHEGGYRNSLVFYPLKAFKGL
jgi:hypothetical protein